MEEIVQAISTVGFPSALCVGLLIFMNKESENHKAETNQLKDVIAENTVALAGLKQVIEDHLK